MRSGDELKEFLLLSLSSSRCLCRKMKRLCFIFISISSRLLFKLLWTGVGFNGVKWELVSVQTIESTLNDFSRLFMNNFSSFSRSFPHF